jgi:hypothetical protein
MFFSRGPAVTLEMSTMITKEENTAPVVDSAGDAPAQLGPDTPLRDAHDIQELSLAMIEAQRKRVARGMPEETRSGRLDKALSVEIKRLNVMLVTYTEIANTPHAKAGPQLRSGAGPVSRILTSLVPKKRRPKQAAPKA